MQTWLKRAVDPQHVRPYARLTLVAVGGFQALIAVLAWATMRSAQQHNSYRNYYGGTGELVAWVLLGAFLLTLALTIISAIRARHEGSRGWWDNSPALLITCGVYGLGTGLLVTWFLEQRISEGALLGFLAAVFGTLALSAVERGRLPILGIVIAILSAALVSLIRIAMINRIGRWDEEEVIISALTALIVLPIGYLLIRGLLILVSGRTHDGSQGLLSTPPPFEVRLVEERLVVRVEAPGLRSAEGVEVSVDGLTVTLRAPGRTPPADGLLFSTRPYGPLHAKVVLPAATNGPVTTSVENGVITVSLSQA